MSGKSPQAGEAERVYRAFLVELEEGRGADFPELCAENPALVPELERLHAARGYPVPIRHPAEEREPASDGAPLRSKQIPRMPRPDPPETAQTDSFWTRVQARYGEQDVPTVFLQEQTADGETSLFTRILGRFAKRGAAFGKYRFEEEIARGGQGVILRVWDGDLHRSLAMKVVLGNEDSEESTEFLTPVDARSLGRFLEEAQVTGQLDHPGIVPVHELGIDSRGRFYFTMKLVKGETLKAIFDHVEEAEEGWTRTRALGVMLKMCEAMAYAHSKGVIHRDLKPSNIMVGRFGEVYIMDWGLARVLGKADTKDIRLFSDVPDPDQVHPARKLQSAKPSDSPVVTMDGDVVGTPAYMSPEQAAGKLDKMGPHSDVYSVGAMLYHLLAEQMPYVPRGVRLNNFTVWNLVQAGPPEPLHSLVKDVPAELVAICEKAMARDPGDRYADMQDLAEDLRSFLEHRVVKAYETGAVAELKKWVDRNQGLAAACAAAVLLLVAGLVTSWILAGKAERQRANVLRLSADKNLEKLKEEAELLWPAFPENIEAMEDWMEEAAELVAGLHPRGNDPGHYRQLEELRAKALPLTPEEEGRQHERYGELERLRQRLAALERARETRAGSVVPASFEVPSEGGAGAQLLNELAWDLVNPERDTFGSEEEGLARARRAVELADEEQGPEADDLRAETRDTLAWAFFAVGLDDEARTTMNEAILIAPEERKEEFKGHLNSLETKIAANQGAAGDRLIAELAAEVAELEDVVSQRDTWRFEDDEEDWWHDQLSELVDEIEAFADPETGLMTGTSAEFGWGVGRRLTFAKELRERTLTGAKARSRWSKAIASIRDRTECPEYDGLVISPQLGLLPIGRDPDSGLWEFADVQTGEIPERVDGKLEISETTGLVFVLIPGGSFTMGAQREDPSKPNFDAMAEDGERPVFRVELDPFFLSKFEMTQGQWRTFTGFNPSDYNPALEWETITLEHPVERLSWELCDRTLERLGFLLPTEAQWEYAARAGTDTPWSTGADRDTLLGHVNLADSAAKQAEIGWQTIQDWPDLDDGRPLHAPVGEYLPNDFGLHDVHGNVREWCRDGWGDLPKVRPGDGKRLHTDDDYRMVRGGSFNGTASGSRSAARVLLLSSSDYNNVGVRPARRLQR